MKRLFIALGISSLLLANACLAQMLLFGAGGANAYTSYTGLITFVNTGTCPIGTTEVSAFAGKTLFGTVNANGDVGGTGGADSITPTTASVTQPTIAWPAGVPTSNAITMSGSTASESTHTHSVTAAGTNGTVSFTPAGTNGTVSFTPTGTVAAPVVSWPAGVPTSNALTFSGTPFSSVINHTHVVTMTWNVQGGTTAATTGTHVMTSTATGGSARAPTTGDVVSASEANPAGGVASITPAGTINTPTLSWPAGVPTNTAPTFTGNAGTISAQTFTGSSGTVSAQTFTGSAVTSAAGSAHSHSAGTLAASTPTLSWPAGVPTATLSAVTMNSFDNRSAYVKWIACKID